MQEDQIGFVGSTLTRLSGGLSFQTAVSIHAIAVGYAEGGKSPCFFTGLVLRLKAKAGPAEALGRQPEPPVGRLPEEPLLHQPGEQLSAFVLVELEQPRRLLDGGREPAHFNELAAYARFDIPTNRGRRSTTMVQRGNREWPGRDVEPSSPRRRRFRKTGRHCFLRGAVISLSSGADSR